MGETVEPIETLLLFVEEHAEIGVKELSDQNLEEFFL